MQQTGRRGGELRDPSKGKHFNKHLESYGPEFGRWFHAQPRHAQTAFINSSIGRQARGSIAGVFTLPT